MATKRAFRLAYDGTAYHGFQRQPDVPTVEGELFAALRALDVPVDESRPPGYAAAGRTDAGVSALAQTIAFKAPDWLVPRALNAELPADVRAWASADTSEGFHATHDAASRTYTYHLHTPDASEALARVALDRLAGEHDFHNLTPDEAGTVRQLETSLHADRPFLVISVRAPGFARHLVRRIVALVTAVARGESGVDRVDRVLQDEPLPGPEGVPTAPPEPLVLTDVVYPDLTFAIDEPAAESAEAVFEQRRTERLTGARVARSVVEGINVPGGCNW